jgi:hypothetical protein
MRGRGNRRDQELRRQADQDIDGGGIKGGANLSNLCKV